MEELLSALLGAMNENTPAVLVSIVADSGSTPRGAGAKMLVLPSGKTLGTIGGGAVEHSAETMAGETLQTGQSRLHEFDLSPNDVAKLGMVCGGRVTVFLQYVNPGDKAAKTAFETALTCLQNRRAVALLSSLPDGEVFALTPGEKGGAPLGFEDIRQGKTHLLEAEGRRFLADPLPVQCRALIFGMGHVGMELVPVLHRLKFGTVAMDDREEFLTAERLPDADERRLVDFPAAFEGLTVTEEDYIVVLTRGHLHDYNVLRLALRTPAKYIGMIGSRAKVALSRQKLADEGFSEEEIARVHAPIGLPLGGETPEEIAVSIAAEMIRTRTGWEEKNK